MASRPARFSRTAQILQRDSRGIGGDKKWVEVLDEVEAAGAAKAAGVAPVSGVAPKRPAQVATVSAPTAGTKWPIK